MSKNLNFKPGDRVRFLNATGGGVVTKTINSFMVSVAIEDGFEIPTLTSELVMIEPGNAASRMFTSEKDRDLAPEPAVVEEQNVQAEPVSDKIFSDPTLSSGVYLLYVPHDQQWIMTGNLDIYLVNNTDKDLLYSFFLKHEDGRFSGIDYGSITKRSRMLIESIVREDINHWSSGVIQVLFHFDETDKVLMPVSTTFRIKGAIFYRETSYRECGLLGQQKAIIYTICELNRIPSTVEHILKEKENPAERPELARQFNPGSAIDTFRIAPREAEVDLHISALREKYDTLSPREILTIQIGTFERMLESALANNYSRIIFIHGVGNGSLKQALVEKVKDYEDIEFRNASFVKYGNGAIELILHQNM